MGRGRLQALHAGCANASRPPHLPLPSPPCFLLPRCRQQSLQSDPLLTFISTSLAARPQPAASDSGGSAPSRGSGALELRTDAKLWEVQWPALTILRAIGRGGRAGGMGGRQAKQRRQTAVPPALPASVPVHPPPAGSFGSVYLAEWGQTRVAVKVLVSMGERLS